VTKWERVSSSFTGWATVEITNQNYFVVGVLEYPRREDIPDLLLLYWVSSRELVQIDNDKFATALSRCRYGQRSSAHH